MTGLTQLRDKIAVITGGASGIGKGIAEHFIAEGMTVVITDIDQQALNATTAELDCTGFVADVTKLQDLAALAAFVKDEFGTAHVLVNNAGVGSMGRIADLTLEDWHWMLDVNLHGVIHGLHAFLPMLRANPDGGHIINTSSMSGLLANPNMGSYTAAKFAVVGLTEVLAQELAEDGGSVGVSVLCPGPVRSNIKASLRTRPEGETGGLFDIDASVEGPLADMRWLDPVYVGKLVTNAIRNNDLYVITHPELAPLVEQRSQRLHEAFKALENSLTSTRIKDIDDEQHEHTNRHADRV